jgi:hypothetical protein
MGVAKGQFAELSESKQPPRSLPLRGGRKARALEDGEGRT